MFDTVVLNGTIVDGKRSKPRQANLGIKGGLIACITDQPISGKEALDATGKVVSPGFIDMHTHSGPYRLASPLAESKLYQGVTFELGGNCGISLIPTPHTQADHRHSQENTASMLSVSCDDWNCEARDIDGLRGRIKKNTIHFGTLIGHGTLRGCVMGFDMRKPTADEMAEMTSLLDTMLKQGAFGLSLGLIYPPGSFCEFDELVELAKVVQANDCILTVHMRNENTHVFDAVDEVLRLSALTGVKLQISHLKLMGVSQWGKAEELLNKIRDAKSKGIYVNADQYPYDASSTTLSALLPKRAHDGGVGKMMERLKDDELLPGIMEEAAQEMVRRGGPERVQVDSTHGVYPPLDGCTIAEISEEWKTEPVDTVIRLLLDCGGAVSCIFHSMSDKDVLAIMKERFVAVASDGRSYPVDRAAIHANPHRRSFGTFPKFLQTVREHSLMPIEDAVYKMTGLPAELIGLKDRGVLDVGKKADITIFDYNNVEDKSTYKDSVQQPAGVEHVLVDGDLTMTHGEITDARNGQLILCRGGLRP